MTLGLNAPKLIIHQLIHVVPVSGDTLVLMQQEKEKQECPGKGLDLSSSQEVVHLHLLLPTSKL